MPEGDTIFRAARTLHRALAGKTVVRFRTVLTHLERVNIDTPLAGRTIERVEARGKHLLIHFSGDLILRTHMRMNGSWHIYRPGERWQRPARDMRLMIATDDFEAVAFRVPVAEFRTAAALARDDVIQSLGPDLLDPEAELEEAVRRLRDRGPMPIADALLRSAGARGSRQHLQVGIAIRRRRVAVCERGLALRPHLADDRRHRSAAARGEHARSDRAAARRGGRSATDDEIGSTRQAVVGIRTRRSSVPAMPYSDCAREAG
jgi:hypothetical protein